MCIHAHRDGHLRMVEDESNLEARNDRAKAQICEAQLMATILDPCSAGYAKFKTILSVIKNKVQYI